MQTVVEGLEKVNSVHGTIVSNPTATKVVVPLVTGNESTILNISSPQVSNSIATSNNSSLVSTKETPLLKQVTPPSPQAAHSIHKTFSSVSLSNNTF